MECLLGQRTSASAASIPLARGVTERRDQRTGQHGTRRTDRNGYAKAAVLPKRNVVIDATATSSTDVRDVEHSECKGLLVVAPWSKSCENLIAARAGLTTLLSLASANVELHIDESGGSRRPYVVKVYVYSPLASPELSARFKNNEPMQLEDLKGYAMYFLFDRTHIFIGM